MSLARAVRLTMTVTLLTLAPLAPALQNTASRVAKPDPIVFPEVSHPETDLRGNDVRKAVAKYRLDPLGALYEEHSPNTDIPPLTDPKS